MTMTATQSISEQAQVVLKHRYLLKDSEGKQKEDSFGMFKRVAKAIAKIENDYYTLPVEAELIENDFFHMMLFTVRLQYILLQIQAFRYVVQAFQLLRLALELPLS